MRQVITYNTVEGFHAWPDAPEACGYLRSRHRHIFVIRTWFNVSHNDREVEINLTGQAIEKAIKDEFGSPCEFGSMSCESIGEFVLSSFPGASRCEVLEDGYGGAALSK